MNSGIHRGVATISGLPAHDDHVSIAADVIRAGRLTLVPLRAGHAGEMADVLADPDLYAFTGGSPPSVADLRSRYERWVAGSPDPSVSWCNWVIQLHGPRCLAGTVQATMGPASASASAAIGHQPRSPG